MALYDYVPQPHECEQVDPEDLSNLTNWGLTAEIVGPPTERHLQVTFPDQQQISPETGSWIVKSTDPNSTRMYRTYSETEFAAMFTPHT
jgi:hypothetical protein